MTEANSGTSWPRGSPRGCRFAAMRFSCSSGCRAAGCAGVSGAGGSGGDSLRKLTASSRLGSKRGGQGVGSRRESAQWLCE
eukprot:10752060-Lingulodinium_polyedra.AAC.1